MDRHDIIGALLQICEVHGTLQMSIKRDLQYNGMPVKHHIHVKITEHSNYFFMQGSWAPSRYEPLARTLSSGNVQKESKSLGSKEAADTDWSCFAFLSDADSYSGSRPQFMSGMV